MPMQRIPAGGLRFLLLLLLSAPKAKAGNDAAEALFRQGREAIVNGETAKGCSLLAESDRLEPSPGAKLGLGLCEEQLGHRARAWLLLQNVIQSLPNSDPRVDIARRHADEIQPQIAFVIVVVKGQYALGQRITSDIAELTTADLGLPLPFDPGSHVFQISAPGHEPQRVTVQLRAGTRERIELALAPPPTERTPSPERRLAKVTPLPAPRVTSPAHSIGLALEGSAAALLVTSLTLGAFALDAKSEMNRGCDASGRCTDAGVRAAERGSTLATTSTLTFVGALASGGLGLLFILLGREPAAPRATANAATPLRINF